MGVQSLVFAGVWSAGFSTLTNSPEEWGRTWEGFGKRYAVRLSGVSISNGIEAGLGSLWKEDPRYFTSGRKGLGPRFRWALAMTFASRRTEGGWMPAYGRYAGVVGNNFITNAWRPPSQSSTSDALVRVGWGFGGRLASNLFDEFWPEIRRKVLRRK